MSRTSTSRRFLTTAVLVSLGLMISGCRAVRYRATGGQRCSDTVWLCAAAPTTWHLTVMVNVCAPDAPTALVRGNRVLIKKLGLAYRTALSGTTCEATTNSMVPYYDLGPDADW